MISTWRKRAEPIIARVLARTRGMNAQSVREALRAAYPFGPRQYHPYKIWLDEIARQQGRRPPLGTRTVPRKGAPEPDDPRQGVLFD